MSPFSKNILIPSRESVFVMRPKPAALVKYFSSTARFSSVSSAKVSRIARDTSTGKLSIKPAWVKRAGSSPKSSEMASPCSAALTSATRIGKKASRVGSELSIIPLTVTSCASKKPPFTSQPTALDLPSLTAASMATITYGEPIRVCRYSISLSLKYWSTASLLLTGIAAKSALSHLATTAPSSSPRWKIPFSSITNGRSLSPSVDTIAKVPGCSSDSDLKYA
ncbi:hypothetical protein D9M68_749200 [compost metagenome]